MAKYLQSGLRRDCCALVCALEEPTGQSLKRALESHYEDRIAPAQFYGALDALVEAGHLTREPDGVTDRYALTDAGEAALLEHASWLADQVGPPRRA